VIIKDHVSFSVYSLLWFCW